MAIAAGTVWEFQSNATAGNVNGGGFNPTNVAAGTDYTQVAGAYTFGDLASTLASSFLVVTSASHNFVAADQGNIIHINTTGTGAHFTVGFYEIVSCSGNAATLDRACGSAADASGGTYHVGGALSMASATDQATFNAMVAGNKAWIKQGTYTLTGTLNVNTAAGTNVLHIQFEGYAVTRGDQPKGSTRPLITGAVTIWNNSMDFTSLQFSTSVASAAFTTGIRNHFNFCSFYQYTNTVDIAACAAGNYGSFVGCEFVSTKGRGLTLGNAMSVANCYFHDSDMGILNSNVSGNYTHTYANNLFVGCKTYAIRHSGANDSSVLMFGNTIYGAENKLGVGLSMITANANVRAWNNIFYGLTTGVSCADATQAGNGTTMWFDFNDFFNNTADVTNVTNGSSTVSTTPGFASVSQVTGSDGTVSSTTFTSASATFSASGVVAGRDYLQIVSGTAGPVVGYYGITVVGTTTLTLDFAPGNSATADHVYQITTGRNFAPGANVKSVGYPSAISGVSTTASYVDMGAAQAQYGLGSATSVDPGVAHVENLTSYSINGTSLVGTLVLPTGGGGKRNNLGPVRMG